MATTREEYRNKIEEIQDLMDSGEEDEALSELDDMNFKKVHNINTLLEISRLYEQAGKYDDAFEVLLIAYDRSPAGRLIIYRLALLSIKMGNLDEAKEYYDRFVYIAPHDNLKYEIRYDIAKASDADPHTLIDILEELKNREFIEKWAYELAKLYHETGQADKCTDLCDEIVLWFGEGPYVERALELKMIYRPLTHEQEIKYRKFQSENSNLQESDLTEIHPEDAKDDSQILNHTVKIPKIELPPEKYDTVNLQAEIKRNIDEIMQATAQSDVKENLDAIKDLTKEFPFLNEGEETEDEKQAKEEKKEAEGRQIDESLKDNFQKYLVEEHDGQISMLLPDDNAPADDTIKGQITIQDIMNDWEKTKRAAEKAIADADKEKLENAKSEALEEANRIADKLSDAAPMLEAGISPSQVLRDEYLSKPLEEDLEDADVKEDVDTVNTKEASKILENVNNMLQKQIEEINRDDAAKRGHAAPVSNATVLMPHLDIDTAEFEDMSEPVESAVSKYAKSKIENEVSENSIDENEGDAEQITPVAETLKPATDDESGILADTVASIMDEEEKEKSEEDAVKEAQREGKTGKEAEAMVFDASPTRDMKKGNEAFFNSIQHDDEAIGDRIVFQTTRSIKNEEKESPDYISSDGLQAEIDDEYSDLTLTSEEKEAFTYFTPISGMEAALAQVLYGSKERLKRGNSSSGNIIIEGGHGSGKTTLALAIIKVLRQEIGKPNNRVGKIDGDKLNEKDIQQLFSKIEGGCLIIEDAGKIKRETAVTMSLLMDNDTTGIFIILEDDRKGIEKVLSLDAHFSRKFTEKISIPILTIDELVNFGEAYADDLGYTIDQMGILALYNRIDKILRLDHPTYLTDVKEIVDQAIDSVEHGGFFSRVGGKKFDENGKRILQEKNFQI